MRCGESKIPNTFYFPCQIPGKRALLTLKFQPLYLCVWRFLPTSLCSRMLRTHRETLGSFPLYFPLSHFPSLCASTSSLSSQWNTGDRVGGLLRKDCAYVREHPITLSTTTLSSALLHTTYLEIKGQSDSRRFMKSPYTIYSVKTILVHCTQLFQNARSGVHNIFLFK